MKCRNMLAVFVVLALLPTVVNAKSPAKATPSAVTDSTKSYAKPLFISLRLAVSGDVDYEFLNVGISFEDLAAERPHTSAGTGVAYIRFPGNTDVVRGMEVFRNFAYDSRSWDRLSLVVSGGAIAARGGGHWLVGASYHAFAELRTLRFTDPRTIIPVHIRDKRQSQVLFVAIGHQWCRVSRIRGPKDFVRFGSFQGITVRLGAHFF